MRIAVSADERTGVAEAVIEALKARGHEPIAHGALNPEERDDWAWASEAAARDVADGRAEQGVVCCWTGTGASIAANKVRGIRAALCGDAATAAGARKWNDANVLALSLRTTSPALLEEILAAWFDAEPSSEADDRAKGDVQIPRSMSAPEDSGENDEPRPWIVLEEDLARAAEIHIEIAEHPIFAGQVVPPVAIHADRLLRSLPSSLDQRFVPSRLRNQSQIHHAIDKVLNRQRHQ